MAFRIMAMHTYVTSVCTTTLLIYNKLTRIFACDTLATSNVKTFFRLCLPAFGDVKARARHLDVFKRVQILKERKMSNKDMRSAGKLANV